MMNSLSLLACLATVASLANAASSDSVTVYYDMARKSYTFKVRRHHCKIFG